MKNLKVLALLVLTVAMILTCFTSCDQLAGIPGIENILDLLPGADTHEHVFSEATCTTPATCECGETNGDALGHTFTEGKCECGETDPNYVPPHEHSFVDGKCECGETDPNYVPPHEHSFVDGKCECGETDPNYVPPHEHNFVDGKCECGETDPNYVPPHEHNFVDGKCECGETDPNYVPPHEHAYTLTGTTATCTAAGVNTYTCECGDSYTEECDVLDHVDANLDITCDFEGCTKRILPAADSTISLFTAQHMIIMSLANNYYVEGTVTSVDDARNGKFVITDEDGYTILIYLPVDENGVTHANWVSKVLVGDVVRVYGKPVNPTGLNTTEKAVVKSGTLTFISKHPHAFGEPTCLLPGYCECGQDGPVALGHVDEDGNDLCDRCEFNLKLDIETITTKYSDIKETDKVDTTNGVATFDGVNFTATFSKNTASFNTNGTDHMRLNKGNMLTVTSNNGKNIVGITLVASSSSYVDELELYCQALGYEYTVDGNEITFSVEACTVLELVNNSSKAQRIAAVKVIYEK